MIWVMQIRLKFIDMSYKTFQKMFIGIVAKVQICDQNNFQIGVTGTGFVGMDVPPGRIQFFCMQKTIKTEEQDQGSSKKSGESKHPSGMKPGSSGKPGKIKDDADQISNPDPKQGIEKRTKPQITDLFQNTVKPGWFFDQKRRKQSSSSQDIKS